jgi:serine/threonine-protein kinase
LDNSWNSESTWVSEKTAPAAPGARVEVGNQLGPYKLVSMLGSGGMGSVFIGEHELIGRRVAIKVLHPDFALNPEIARRFLQEARLANSIASENVVAVEDFVRTPEGFSYLVMELLEGADVAATVATEGILPVARSVAIVRQVAEALAAVHRARIIHRDLKPENIFLVQKANRRDLVKLLDFGLAKLSESHPDGNATRAGSVLGTPNYMSPEQAFGLNIDHRTDIFALGIILYWLLSGALPFQGGDSLPAQREARRRPVARLPPKTPNGEPIPEALASLAADCLQKDPTARPATMLAVIERLGAGAKRRRGPVVVAVALGVVALLAAGGGLVARQSGGQASPQTGAAAPTPTLPSPATPTLAPVPVLAPTPNPSAAPTPSGDVAPVPAAHVQKPAVAHPTQRRPSRSKPPPAPAPKVAPAPQPAAPADPYAPLPNR